MTEGEDAWSAADALELYWESGAPRDRVTVSSDGGGCLPVFNSDGEVVSMEVGDCSALMQTIRQLSQSGRDIGQVLAPFTKNWAALLRFARHGRLSLGSLVPSLIRSAGCVALG